VDGALEALFVEVEAIEGAAIGAGEHVGQGGAGRDGGIIQGKGRLGRGRDVLRAEELGAAVVTFFRLLIGLLGVFEGGVEMAMFDEVNLLLGGVETADFPGGGDDLFDEQ
jgi:hypothetical protein